MAGRSLGVVSCVRERNQRAAFGGWLGAVPSAPSVKTRPGAHYQPMGHVQMVLNLFDYGMDIQSAIDAPRAFFEGENTVIERGMPAATVEGLKARGHNIVTAPSPWGGAQAIRIDWDRGVLIGGSEPRKDGCALGY